MQIVLRGIKMTFDLNEFERLKELCKKYQKFGFNTFEEVLNHKIE